MVPPPHRHPAIVGRSPESAYHGRLLVELLSPTTPHTHFPSCPSFGLCQSHFSHSASTRSSPRLLSDCSSASARTGGLGLLSHTSTRTRCLSDAKNKPIHLSLSCWV